MWHVILWLQMITKCASQFAVIGLYFCQACKFILNLASRMVFSLRKSLWWMKASTVKLVRFENYFFSTVLHIIRSVVGLGASVRSWDRFLFLQMFRKIMLLMDFLFPKHRILLVQDHLYTRPDEVVQLYKLLSSYTCRGHTEDFINGTCRLFGLISSVNGLCVWNCSLTYLIVA